MPDGASKPIAGASDKIKKIVWNLKPAAHLSSYDREGV